MIIRFHSEAHADISLFADVAKKLLQLMGCSDRVPGALLAADVPAALQRLRDGLEQQPQTEETSGKTLGYGWPEDEDQDVSLKTRAFPVVEMLESAARDNADIIWEVV